MFVCSECGAGQAVEGRCPADGTQLQSIGEDVLLGTTIGAYRVATLLGIGGMGRVYKGVHPTIGSRVAIKVLSRECSDRRDLVERFFAEAKAVNLIRHESIVNVLDLATLPDGRPYIIMEYLDGAALAAIVEHAVQLQQPLPLGGLARLAVEVLDALGAAHGKNIVHRDLKPDNIFVLPSGRPKVLDFGIAKLSDVTSTSTRTGSLLGTPHYMSPEQAAGKPADHRADIYAIGVILFECATGRKPFQADSLFDLLRMHIEAPPPRPASMRHDLSPDLEHVILTALAKAPDQRFASAHAMSAALQHATASLSAEQWTPITGTGTHRGVPSGAWAPTPPASWGGEPRGPRPSVQPPLVQPAPIGHRSTVSASSGQVQQQPPARSSAKGIWIAVAALVLVGGGVTAAVVAGGGDGGGPNVETASGSSAGDPGSAALPPPVDPPAEPATPDDDSPSPPAEAIDPDRARRTVEEAAAAELDKAFAELDKTMDSLPPAARKQLEEMKRINKLPPGERIKRFQQLQQELTSQVSTDVAERMDPPEPPAPPPRPAPGKWSVESYRMRAVPGFDPRRVDVSKVIRFAIAEAKKADPGAVLFRIDVDSVGPDGVADLTLPSFASDHGSLDLRFFSPARAKRDPSLPLGVPQKHGPACEFRIEVDPGGAEMRVISGFDCSKNKPVPAPKCSAAALWKRAIAKGAPSANAVASLGYRATSSGSILWYFDIGTPGDKIFSRSFPDGC